jgi:hypothetical protein
MREIRQSGSEGGGGESNRLSLPLSTLLDEGCRFSSDDSSSEISARRYPRLANSLAPVAPVR